MVNIMELANDEALQVLGFELKHIGINCENEAEAENVADRFDHLFGFTKKVGNSSVFARKEIEAMKTPFLGTKGHICIATTDVEQAMEYLMSKGATFDMSTAKRNAEGFINAVYLEEEIGGFAVHLLRK